MLLPVSHVQQQQQADCLAACAAMILQYLQIPFAYERLRRWLGTTEGGAAFVHLEQLRVLGLSVHIRRNDDISALLVHLETWLPIIVAVETWALPYWQSRLDIDDSERETDHAVVVVGLVDDTVYLNDPSFAEVPQTVTVDAFLAAWAGFAYLYAVIGLTEVE